MKNKSKLMLGIASIGVLGMVGAGIGSLNGNVIETKAEDEIFYCRSTENGWGTSSPIIEGEDPSSFSFSENEEFKFDDGQWTNTLGYSNLEGTAKGFFVSSDGDNIKCNFTGRYNVSISGSTLYIDLIEDETEFYYVSSENEWDEDADKDKPVKINGSPVSFNLTKGEEFKLKHCYSWDIALGWDTLLSDYNSCFAETESDGNIKVNHTATYDVSITSESHQLKLNIVAHSPTSNTVYVLDLYGDLLNNSHKAHYFNSTDSIETDWPGVDMSLVGGTSNVYSATYWDAFASVIFNQKGDGEKTGQTIDLTLTGNEGKCLILNHDVNGEYKWNSNTWLSLEAAEFIDGKMHFADVSTDNTGSTANCESYYGAAKTAYNGLSTNSVRLEVLSIDVASARLNAWATANNDELDAVSGNVLAAGSVYTISERMNANNNMALAIGIASASVLVSVGGFLFLRRKRENN